MSKVGVAIFGLNGHQIHSLLTHHPKAELVAAGACSREQLPAELPTRASIPIYDTLEGVLNHEQVDLVSLCSPRRADQAGHAVQCLEQGRHVYAEKPCATTEADLDAILTAADRSGAVFHEMASTAFEQPYFSMRRLVQSGTIGEVVQILAQKSYPYHARRPQDEAVDGGLICQNGVHALRLIEHVSGLQATEITALETGLGNRESGGLMMACTMIMPMENGALATAIANYLNSNAFGSWGNETLRIFGTRGFVETVDGGSRTRLCLENEDLGPFDAGDPGWGWFGGVLDDVLGMGKMPIPLEEEVHPTRMVLRAKAAARVPPAAGPLTPAT